MQEWRIVHYTWSGTSHRKVWFPSQSVQSVCKEKRECIPKKGSTCFYCCGKTTLRVFHLLWKPEAYNDEPCACVWLQIWSSHWASQSCWWDDEVFTLRKLKNGYIAACTLQNVATGFTFPDDAFPYDQFWMFEHRFMVCSYSDLVFDRLFGAWVLGLLYALFTKMAIVSSMFDSCRARRSVNLFMKRG